MNCAEIKRLLESNEADILASEDRFDFIMNLLSENNQSPTLSNITAGVYGSIEQFTRALSILDNDIPIILQALNMLREGGGDLCVFSKSSFLRTQVYDVLSYIQKLLIVSDDDR